jgi:hypothetical protein
MKVAAFLPRPASTIDRDLCGPAPAAPHLHLFILECLKNRLSFAPPQPNTGAGVGASISFTGSRFCSIWSVRLQIKRIYSSKIWQFLFHTSVHQSYVSSEPDINSSQSAACIGWYVLPCESLLWWYPSWSSLRISWLELCSARGNTWIGRHTVHQFSILSMHQWDSLHLFFWTTTCIYMTQQGQTRWTN